MKIPPARLETFLDHPAQEIRAVLVYGPDLGLARERLDRLAKSVCPDLKDPFRVSDLTPASLKDDAARLADEAAAMSLTGGRRVVRIFQVGDGLASLFSNFLAAASGDSLVVVGAGDLGAKSALRKIFEEAPNAAAIPCYVDDLGGLENLARRSLAQHKITIESEALDYLVENLGQDRLANRAEIEKLALYAGDGRRVTLADVQATIGDGASSSADDLAFAVAEGKQLEVQRALDHLMREGGSPVALLRSVTRHLQRLHYARGLMAQGKSADQAVNALKPKVFFKRVESFRSQLRVWNEARLAQAMELLVQAELDCKTTGMPAEAVCGRCLMQLARAARPR